MTGDEAIEIIARHAVARSVESLAEEGWDFYPEIGEHDWERIVAKAQELRPWPEAAEFKEAYKLLEARAETDAELDA